MPAPPAALAYHIEATAGPAAAVLVDDVMVMAVVTAVVCEELASLHLAPVGVGAESDGCCHGGGGDSDHFHCMESAGAGAAGAGDDTS